MSRLICMAGLPGSGKTTKARELLIQYGNGVRINRDELRTMLHVKAWSGRQEGITRQAARVLVIEMLRETGLVIIDDTNLSEKTIQSWKALVQDCQATFEMVRMDTSVEECLKRDREREKSVGRHVILGMALQYGLYPRPAHGIVLCDLDGTLADITHRIQYVKSEPKNWRAFFENILQDSVRQDVWQQVYDLREAGHEVIFLSGRPDTTRQDSEQWLQSVCHWSHPTLFMRRTGDHRPDADVKRDILQTYFPDTRWIHCVFDDRPSVIRMWREAGLSVVDVGTGIEF